MKNTFGIWKMTVIALAVTLLGCNPEDNHVPGAGGGKMGLAFKLSPGNNGGANARVSGQGVTFKDGFIQIKELELEVEGRNENGEFEKEIEIKFDDIKKVAFDQFDSSTDFFIQIPEGEYKDIEMEIDLIDHRNEPSILLSGVYENANGTNIPVRFELYGDEIDFEVEIESGDDRYFKIDRVNNPLILFELNPQRWVSSISNGEWENADLTDGTILITRNSNRSIFNKIKNRIEASSEIEIEID